MVVCAFVKEKYDEILLELYTLKIKTPHKLSSFSSKN